MKKMLSRILICTNAFFIGSLFNNQFPNAMNFSNENVDFKTLSQRTDYIYDIIKKNVEITGNGQKTGHCKGKQQTKCV